MGWGGRGWTSFSLPTPPGALPPDSSPAGFSHPPGPRRSQTLHRPGGSSLHHLLRPSQGAQPHPRVAAQSPPPPRPREQASGTEFNRHHQQPPGRLGKVDTLIPATVSGERAAAPCSSPPPRGGRPGANAPLGLPLPGRRHGAEPYGKHPIGSWLRVPEGGAGGAGRPPGWPNRQR